jgi:hypothetical protein
MKKIYYYVRRENEMKTIALSLLFAVLLVGCRSGDTGPQSTTGASPSASIASRWLQNCVVELGGNQANEVRWFSGMGANDVVLMPGDNIIEDILQRCQKVSPLSDAEIPFYKIWLKERISEIQAITPGTGRADVDKTLLQNGGLSTRGAAIYSHRDCTVLKVRVEFDESNEVKAVSPPYLGLFICD